MSWFIAILLAILGLQVAPPCNEDDTTCEQSAPAPDADDDAPAPRLISNGF